MNDPGRLRIGELSRRVGVSPELLRAWERRYELVQPQRTPGGLRLYGAEDERRVRLMLTHLADGLSASEAARLARIGGHGGSAVLAEVAASLERALAQADETAAQSALDRLFAGASLETALSEVILPLLNRLGRRWAAAETSVAEEHFASNVIEGRLRSMSRDWERGVGPRALLACPSGERHELGLLCFGLALRAHGWRIAYLGADTPIREITSATDRFSPDVVVLASVRQEHFLASADEITELAREVRVAIGGAGAEERVASRLGVELLADDAVASASALAR
ncbi:MAG: HTH-type transcriptional repressor CarH [Thermoleophilaceae bacterium]